MTFNISATRINTVFLSACLLAWLLVVPAGNADADESVRLHAEGTLLLDYAVQFVQRVNVARSNPLAEAARLGLEETLVRDVFADMPWVIDSGLPPLAWNDLLVESAKGHGNDMFARVYYSYVSPEGTTVAERIEDTGYQSLFVGETMSALVFQRYVPIEEAFQVLVDSLIRDELSGSPSVNRNIFSPDLTEIGVVFLADSIDLLGENSYVYLLLADFALPQQWRPQLVVKYDEPGRLIAHTLDGDRWLFPRELRPGYAQVTLPESTAELFVVGEDGMISNDSTYFFDGRYADDSAYLDISSP